MAISSLLPRKTMRNRTRQQSMEERHKYDQNDVKTQNGELLSSYMCSPETAAEEFEASKKCYEKITGRSLPQKHDVIMYRIVQSFKPGEVTPEEANRIGYELAMKFTGGQHQFVVATHVDKKHIHNHIEFNSTNLNCDGKFKNVKNSAGILRRMNDEVCRAHGLSVIEHPKDRAKGYGEAAAIRSKVSYKDEMRQTIDRIIPYSNSFDDFLARMRAEGYEVKRGKYLAFRAPAQERFTRSFRLGDGYTEEVLRSRCQHRRGYSAEAKRTIYAHSGKPINLLIDIQAKLNAGKGIGYERWAKTFNLKEAAKTLNFLIDHDLTDYNKLVERVETVSDDFDKSADRIKRLEAQMAEIAQLKTHIIQYSKTRDVYAAYKKSRHKKEFLAEHADEIARHEAAKKAFDALGGKPVPKVAQLSAQYGALLAEKREEYERYRELRNDMITYQTALKNVDAILGLEHQENERGRQTR